MEASYIIEQYERNKGFYANGGGLTVTGGEPLLQIDFLTELFRTASAEGIHTCIDTSGMVAITEDIKELLKYTDLVLLDIKLAKLNGIELAKYIRKQSKRIKIVFLTAYEHFWPEGYKVLASRFLVKPLSDDELYDEISPLLDEINCLSSYVLVSEKKELVRVEIDDILYFSWM